jgi:hypothetical protein
MTFSQYCKLLGYLLKNKQTKKQKQKTTTIKYTSSSSYPQLFPIRPGMAQVFIRQRCRHFGFTDDFVTKRNNK